MVIGSVRIAPLAISLPVVTTLDLGLVTTTRLMLRLPSVSNGSANFKMIFVGKTFMVDPFAGFEAINTVCADAIETPVTVNAKIRSEVSDFLTITQS
jgi:hypothetical protein